MNCHEARSLLHGYLDGEISELEARRFENHLSSCSSCAEEFRQYSLTRDLVARYGRQKAPPEIINNVRMGMQKEQPRRRSLPVYKLALAASFVVAVLGVLYFNIDHKISSEYMVRSKQETTHSVKEEKAIEKAAPVDAAVDAGVLTKETMEETARAALPAARVETSEESVPETRSVNFSGIPSTEDMGTVSPAAPEPVVAEAGTEILEESPADVPPRRRAVDGSADDGMVVEEPAVAMLEENSGTGMSAAGDEMSEADLAREQMFRALNERESKRKEIASRSTELAEASGEPAVPSAADLGYSSSAGLSERRSGRVETVSYSAGGTSPSGPGYHYVDLPAESDAIVYFLSQNAPSRPAVTPGAGAGQPGIFSPAAEVAPGMPQQRVARAASVFRTDRPLESAAECAEIISSYLAESGYHDVRWRQSGTYIVIKGSFEALAPLRLTLLEHFDPGSVNADVAGEEPAPESAGVADRSDTVRKESEMYGIDPGHPAVLEINFLPAEN